jgi:hypothetical protein
MLAAFLLILLLMRVLVVRPQHVVHPETFLTPQTQGFLFVEVRADDPLMLQVVRALLVVEPGGPGVRKKTGERPDPEMVLQLMKRAAPVQFVLILQAGDEGLAPAGMASAYKYAPLVSALVRAALAQGAEQGEASVEEYNGARLYTGGANTVVVRGNNFGFTESPATARIWVDRLVEQRDLEERAGPDSVPVPDVPGGGKLAPAHGRLDRGASVRFAVVNTGPEAAWLLSRFPEGPVRDALVEAGAGGQSVVSVAGQIESLSASSGGLTLFIECADAASAEALRAAVAEIGRSQAEDAILGAVAARLQDDNVVVVTGVIDRLPRKAVGLVRYLDEKGKATGD